MEVARADGTFAGMQKVSWNVVHATKDHCWAGVARLDVGTHRQEYKFKSVGAQRCHVRRYAQTHTRGYPGLDRDMQKMDNSRIAHDYTLR